MFALIRDDPLALGNSAPIRDIHSATPSQHENRKDCLPSSQGLSLVSEDDRRGYLWIRWIVIPRDELVRFIFVEDK